MKSSVEEVEDFHEELISTLEENNEYTSTSNLKMHTYNKGIPMGLTNLVPKDFIAFKRSIYLIIYVH